MDNDRSVIPGARFYKADLHIHTPASKCWQGQKDDRELERIFEKARSEGIEVVSITDHNTVKSISAAMSLGRKYGIHVYPGVEVSTKEGHVLAIFDPAKDMDAVKEWLMRLGIPESEHGNPEVVAMDHEGNQLSITSVFKAVELEGGVAIAPHPNSKGTGFLEVLKQKGRARTDAYQSPYLRGLELGPMKEQVVKLARGEVPGYKKRYGCVAASDAHKVEDIGREFCYIKLGDIGIGALKQVFYDPGMRIRFKGEWPEKSHAWLDRLEVSQGFFGGMEFKFHPDMNCLVGGKAVGKSVLIEMIKFGLGICSPIGEINDSSKNMIKSNTCLGDGGTVTIHVHTENGDKYRIQRTVSELDQGPEVFYEGTETKVGYPATEIFPCQVYSQNEVIYLGKNLPALLDWLDGFLDLSQEQETIRELDAKTRELFNNLDEKHIVAVGVEALELKKMELEKKRKLLEEKVREPILQTFPKWQQEQRELRDIQIGLDKLSREVIEQIEKIKVEEYFPSVVGGTPNVEDIIKQRDALGKVSEDFSKAAGILKAAVMEKRKAFQTFVENWRKEYEKAEEEYARVIKSAGVKNASALASELDKCIQVIEKTQKELQKAQKARREKSTIEQTLRNTLMPAYTECFASIFKKRLDKAGEIANKLDSFVRIHVLQMDDRTRFEEMVQGVAKGSGLHKDQCEKIARSMTPVRLTEIIVDRNVQELSKTTGIAETKANAFIENAWSNVVDENGLAKPSELYEIMLTELKDTVAVELKVGEGEYKPMGDLSGGSKCTAILSVALVEGTYPLIVDQPEDALDNPFVFERIVQTVRRTKSGRQYIFATHNPNVAVASDADIIYCLKATASRGDIDKHGSIDEVSTRDKVVANLEGGHNAFRLRSQKYDIVVEDPNAVVIGLGED